MAVSLLAQKPVNISTIGAQSVVDLQNAQKSAGNGGGYGTDGVKPMKKKEYEKVCAGGWVGGWVGGREGGSVGVLTSMGTGMERGGE